VRRRVNVQGEIRLEVRGLPPGVTASPAVIGPDENQAFLILTAAPDAQPGNYSLAKLVGTAAVDGKQVEREAAPQEVYRIQNNPQNIPRTNMVVTVGPPAAWTVSLEPSSLTLSPGGEPVTVTARLKRSGMEGDLPFALVGLPQGVQAPRSLLFKRGQTEMTFTLTPTDAGVFARNSTAAGFSFAIVNGREGEAMMMASPPLPVRIAR
jgi:hypothetical protein